MVGSVRNARRTLLAGLVALTPAIGCESPIAPLPDEAEQFVPPAAYRVWWNEIEQCAGRSASFAAVDWYVVRTSATGFIFDGRYVAAVWTTAGNRIVMAEHYLDKPHIVRHEMLHAILHTGAHPGADFAERCGALVDQSN